VLDDYILVINSKIREKYNLKKYAIVKYLFKHQVESDWEYKEFRTLARVLVDDNLSDNEVALDQTLRNALGIPYNYEENNVMVELARAKLSFKKRLLSIFNSGRHVLLRVEKPDIIDIEKDYCRISDDVIKVLQTDVGKRIVIDGIYPQEEIGLGHIKEVERFINLNENLVSNFSKELLLLRKIESYDRLVKLLNVNKNVLNIVNYIINKNYIIKSIKVEAQATNQSFYDKVKVYRKENKSNTLNTRYPNPLEILNIKNDLMSIHLDSFYRSEINADLLDSVRVRRYWFDIFKTEIIDYGLLFVISVFTTVLAIDSDSFNILPFALGFSLFLTVIIIIYRNR
jgi:hypothetical protein